jgi:hypothetical protein
MKRDTEYAFDNTELFDTIDADSLQSEPREATVSELPVKTSGDRI